MGLILLVGIAVAVGGLLVVALVLAGPNPAALGASGSAGWGNGASAEPSWVGRLEASDLRRLLAMLFEEMKFEVSPLDSEGGGPVLLLADDPTPIKGMKLLVYGLPSGAPPQVDADIVREVLETARGEEAAKGVVVTVTAFTEEARKTADGLPVDLVDGEQLLGLVRKHLPQVAAQGGF